VKKEKEKKYKKKWRIREQYRVYDKENKREKSRGVLHTPSMIYKIVGQASRLSKIDSRFRGNDRE
jgi:hypothetical protein